MKNKIILGVAGALVLVLLVSGSVAGTLFLTGALDKEPAMAAAAPEVEPEVVLYHDLKPEFVVNFKGKARVKFLMIEMVVATNDELVPTVLTDHDPEIRNVLLMMLAEQDSEALKTTVGKQSLRDEATRLIDEVVTRHYEGEKIKDVFITRLVMQ